MAVHAPTELFVYGTLRHDQPEHARYCRGVTAWTRARLRGRLYRIVEGYRLLVLPAVAILQRATDDPHADDMSRRAFSPAVIEAAAAAASRADPEATWIEGELLRFAEAAMAWPPLDAWEGTSTHGDSVYARVVVPVYPADPDQPPRAAWVYASTRVPAGAVAWPADDRC